jgi:methylmalonyl-CoA carboxyltransferase small subunit
MSRSVDVSGLSRKGTGNLKLQIKIDGKTYQAEVEVLEDEASPHQPGYAPYPPVSAASQIGPAPGAYTPSHAAEVHGADEKQYHSPVTGLVNKVNVKPGQEIQPNDLIMVLEAMKMETSITAHHAGKVKSVNVAPGDPVKVRQILVEME